VRTGHIGLILLIAACVFSAPRSLAQRAVYHCDPSVGVHTKEPYFVRAEVNHIEWSVMTRGRLSPDDVRRLPGMRTNLFEPHDIKALLRTMDIAAMNESRDGSTKTGDARLVVDLWDACGGRVAYYSDGALLMSEDGRRWRSVDQDFRERLSAFPGR
jgi:hypothetical protein